MNTDSPARYELLSPAPSQVVAPGGKSPASHCFLIHPRNWAVAGLAIVQVRPASSAILPPNDCRTDVIRFPSSTFDRAKPIPYVLGGVAALDPCCASSSQVWGASSKPADLSRSARRNKTLPKNPNGTP